MRRRHRPSAAGAVRSRGDAAGRRRRRRLRRDRRRREDEARRDPHVHDLRVVARRRRDVVGQHLPGRRGRRRLAPLLVLVQVARLDPHPRQAGRAAEVPRGDRRRVRAAPAPAARRRRCESATWDDDRHVWTVRLDDGTTDECHVLISGVGFLNVPRYPDWPGLDDFDGPEVPHRRGGSTSTTSPARSSRWWARARRRRRSSPRSSPIVGQPVRVPARAGLGDAQGRPRLHRRGAQDVLEPVAAPAGTAAAEVGDGEEHLGRQDLPGRHEGERRPARSSASTTSTRRSRTGPTCARPSRRSTRIRASGRSSRAAFYPALKEPNVELVPKAVASVTPTGHRRRRRRRARRSTSS